MLGTPDMVIAGKVIPKIEIRQFDELNKVLQPVSKYQVGERVILRSYP